MSNKQLIVIGVIVVIASVAIFDRWYRVVVDVTTPEIVTPAGCPEFNEGTATISKQTFHVAIADGNAERSKGLSGCSELPTGTGMYFPYSEPQIVQFWMKDMLIPLDFVWIHNAEIIGLEQNVPPAAARDEDPPRYQPPAPITGVLEIPAGTIANLDIAVGEIISIDTNPPSSRRASPPLDKSLPRTGSGGR